MSRSEYRQLQEVVREDCGSDLFESDDDVADHNYVQPSQFTNSNDFRWSLELLHTAIREHRWDNAFRFLPCVITHTAPHLPLEFLLRVTDVITRNVPSLSVDDRKKFRSILHGMKLETSVFHDILSQDLAEATDRDADGLLQMIEDIQNQRQPPAQGIETRTDKRFKALSDGYIGLVHYHRWKSSLLNATAASPATGREAGIYCSECQCLLPAAAVICFAECLTWSLISGLPLHGLCML
ncbi:hypothetical protein O3P69_020285 [Scylla paramamosain]|uniref:Uncharacterized protein n=1 Tax=Scylla paramamosain TaxID=85552 RepID=A0AAW0SF83_SCYPA